MKFRICQSLFAAQSIVRVRDRVLLVSEEDERQRLALRRPPLLQLHQTLLSGA